MKMTVAELTKSRKKLGISQMALSKMLKKNAGFICKIENKHRGFGSEIQLQVQKAFKKFRKSK